jgi:photosystem II stability/assembly factor-like uncharacterized protein
MFVDARHWWVLVETPGHASQQSLFVTSDGGRTWSGALANPGILDFFAPSPSAGWAVFQDYGQALMRLARTTDGGAHWTAITIPVAVDQ